MNVGLRLATKGSVWILTLSYLLKDYAFYVFAFWFVYYLKEVLHFSVWETSWLSHRQFPLPDPRVPGADSG